ncbi:hypothetical protein [Methylobacterium haplocladii]|uniref:hypothetical protein n=1 Tax=Methylobacterium haplocladii TaxID=1176176 RepID=UPI001478EB3F|nr:hypothetical protein [Methylobacterium haplocladii]
MLSPRRWPGPLLRGRIVSARNLVACAGGIRMAQVSTGPRTGRLECRSPPRGHERIPEIGALHRRLEF